MKIIRTGVKIQRQEAKKFFFENYKKGEVINVVETANNLKVAIPTIYNWMNQINNPSL